MFCLVEKQTMEMKQFKTVDNYSNTVAMSNLKKWSFFLFFIAISEPSKVS